MKIGEGCPHSMPRPPERLFKWRHQFPFLAQAAELAAVENQRRRGGKLAQLDLADENHVVAFRVAAAVVAFEPGRCATARIRCFPTDRCRAWRTAWPDVPGRPTAR